MTQPASIQPTAAFDVLGREHGQVGIVVPALGPALTAHEGMGPWKVYTYAPDTVPNLQWRGAPAGFGFRIALNPCSPQLELIEALDDPGPFGRAGIHHLGYFVDDVAAATAAMRAAGFAVLMSGSGYGADGTGGFCYFDTEATVGYVMEAIERPLRRREPEAVWP